MDKLKWHDDGRALNSIRTSGPHDANQLEQALKRERLQHTRTSLSTFVFNGTKTELRDAMSDAKVVEVEIA
jgi:hypothetical protein